ncbi:MAG: phosphomannomutase/phosphoglucomutase [Formosimonas sp.]
MLAKSIFKAYDIRGIVDETLTEDAVRRIGHAIGSQAAAQGVRQLVLGRDGRLSGLRLQTALADGVIRAGVDVIDVGMVPTPVVYFATRLLNTGSGVMVTGSHNPPQYNGLKMMLAGRTLYGADIIDLYQRIVDEQLHTAETAGHVIERNVLPEYIDAMCADITLHRPMHVAVDCGNGVGGVVASQLLQRLGCMVTELFCEVDGNFPNHHPDPAEPHNLIDLQNTLRDGTAEIGLAFDGDADRLGVVTQDGQIIYPDRQMMLFAQDILSRIPNATVLYDVKCSAHLPRFIAQHGGQSLMWKTGHSLMKAKLQETRAEFAGEMSGHLYFNDRWGGLDDGLYAAARLLEIVSRSTDVNGVLNNLPQGISTPEITVRLNEGEGHALMQQLAQTAQFDQAHVSTVDGLRADYADGFGLVRASNTTPSLVLRFEADDAAGLQRIQNEFKQLLVQAKPEIVLPF